MLRLKPTFYFSGFLLSFLSSGQGSFNDLKNTIRIPNSPEAEAFMKYGNYEVNLYTGTPTISVPIHTFEGREMSLPVSLTYDASGIKVGQTATSSGLGWNLSVGGRISRITNGAPDDYHQSLPSPHKTIWNEENGTAIAELIHHYSQSENYLTFSSIDSAEMYLDFLKSAYFGEIDTQVDYFMLNVMGLNAFFTISIDPNEDFLKPKVLNNPRIKVEITKKRGISIEEFKVTGEDGTVYNFQDTEVTRYEDNDFFESEVNVYGITKEYNSSWLLSEVRSPNQQDVFELLYESLGNEFEAFIVPVADLSVTTQLESEKTGQTFPVTTGSVTNFQPSIKTERTLLTSITHNGSEIYAMSYTNRSDLANKNGALDKIRCYDQGVEQKQIQFSYSYFGNNDGRLKLDKVDLLDSEGLSYGNKYTFRYISPELVPSINSLGRDKLGYYNGKDRNTTLIPSYSVGENDYEGANRSYNSITTKYGTLSSITYPTGGRTDFSYQNNHIKTTNYDTSYTYSRYVGYVSVRGEENPDESVCGPYCQDRWGTTPSIKQEVFILKDTAVEWPKKYEVRVDLQDVDGEAYLHKLPNSSPVAFEDIFELEQLGFWISNQSTSEVVFLDQGPYQITVVNSKEGTVNSCGVLEEITVESSGTRNVTAGGIRIASIKNYAADGTYASGKEYLYSEGAMLYEPTLIDFFKIRGDIFGEHTRSVDFMVRYATASGHGNQPHIAYKNVRVVERGSLASFGSSSFDNGATLHTFKTGRSGWQSLHGISWYASNSAEIGKEITRQINNLDFTEQQIINNYERSYLFGQSALLPMVNNDYFAHVLHIYPSEEDGGKVYRISKVPTTGVCLIESVPLGSCPQTLAPPICSQDDHKCYGVDKETRRSNETYMKVASLEMRLIPASGYYDYLQHSAEKNFFENQEKPVLTTYRTELTDDAFLLPRTQTTTTSAGDTIKAVYSYPSDQSDPVYSRMVANHQINKVIQSERYKVDAEGKEKPLAAYRLNYAVNGVGYYPSSREMSVGDHPLEVREIYTYNSSGNVREAETLDLPGVKQIFLYSYEHRFLVARIIDAELALVNDKLMESGITLSQLEAHYYDEDTLLGYLQKLYELPNAQVTLYTYIPGRGVKTMLDSSQQKRSYLYDDQGRLHQMLDHQGHTIQQFHYELDPR